MNPFALLINLVLRFAAGTIRVRSAGTMWLLRERASVAAAIQNTWLISSAINTRIMK
jgi:hypothetical protein